MDVYGYLQIKGRIKDLIIRGGENICPAEIEKILDTHPKVKEAQVSARLAFHRMLDGQLTPRYRRWITYGREDVFLFRWLEWRISVWVRRCASSSDWEMERTAMLKKSEITAGTK